VAHKLRKVTDSTEPEEPSSSPAEETVPRRRGRRLPKAPTQQELDALPARERLELIDRRRASVHQSLNSVGILFGVLFTAGSLVATALGVRTTQNELHNSQEGQITDRYTKAVDQLGSGRLDIRLGGIYALERLATDSPRDHRTIYDVLTAFVREHDPKPDAKIPDQPATDIQAALTVIGRRKGDDFTPDLTGIRVHNADLSHANLAHASVSQEILQRKPPPTDAQVHVEVFSDADLTGANLTGAILTGAILTSTNLSATDLSGANMRDANMRGADLRGADLSGARLRFEPGLNGTNLADANLADADLSGADLTNADLSGTDLTGANLSGVRGMTPDQIRRQALTDSRTRF
jgi:uncharacterized protein YjbI with pentapeptide repeats